MRSKAEEIEGYNSALNDFLNWKKENNYSNERVLWNFIYEYVGIGRYGSLSDEENNKMTLDLIKNDFIVSKIFDFIDFDYKDKVLDEIINDPDDKEYFSDNYNRNKLIKRLYKWPRYAASSLVADARVESDQLAKNIFFRYLKRPLFNDLIKNFYDDPQKIYDLIMDEDNWGRIDDIIFNKLKKVVKNGLIKWNKELPKEKKELESYQKSTYQGDKILSECCSNRIDLINRAIEAHNNWKKALIVAYSLYESYSFKISFLCDSWWEEDF